MNRSLLCALVLTATVQAENITFPPGLAGKVVDLVEAYGLVGDGTTDNSEAFQRAVDEHKGKNRTLYLRNGTYLISRPVGVFNGKAHSSDRFLTFQGQSEAGTVIRVADRSAAFADAKEPGIALCVYKGQGTGDVMHSYVRNLTIDTGSGNPGAVGLRYLSNNTGAIEHVTIRSGDGSGHIGLDLTQGQQGPCLVKAVTVEGFDTGVATGSSFSIVVEHLTLRKQGKVGFRNAARTTIRNLMSANAVPALRLEGWNQMTLVDATLSGGSQDQTAIVIDCEQRQTYLRDVKVSDYGTSLTAAYKRSDKTFTETGDLGEWMDGPAYQPLGSGTAASLRLAPAETPVVPWEEDPEQWIVFAGAKGDATAALQAAIDAGVSAQKTTLAIVGTKDWHLSGTIRIHGSINRIIGMSSLLDVKDPHGHFKDPKNPVFRFERLSAPVIVVERFFLLGGWDCPPYAVMFGNDSKAAVVIKNVNQRGRTKLAHPGQTWFFEDYGPSREATLEVGAGEMVYARQFNPESPEAPMIDVAGGQLWLLGLKTEGRSTHCIARDGAKVEILGGVCYQSWKGQKLDPPVLVVKDAALSATFGFYHHETPFTTIAEETRSGKTATLLRKDLAPYHLHLYRSGAP